MGIGVNKLSSSQAAKATSLLYCTIIHLVGVVGGVMGYWSGVVVVLFVVCFRFRVFLR